MFRWTRTQEKTINQAISVALLSILLAVNAWLFSNSLRNSSDFTSSVLLFLNMAAVVLIFGIFSIRSFVDTERVQLVKLFVDFLVGTVATCIACSWLISLVYALNYRNVLDYQISFLSSMLIVVLFGYYVFFKDHT